MNGTPHRTGDDEPTVRIVSPEASSHRSTPIPEGRHLHSGELLAGRYRLLEVVGRGGMGLVYRAEDTQLGLCVALKVLRPELADDAQLIERFRRELVLARQVSHRNAVRIHDLGQDGDLLFLTMDFIEGCSLQALLRDEGPLPAGRAVDIVRQLALALEAAHEAGIIHRDLKPGNILIEPSGRAFVSDFGVARSLGSHDLTRAGAVIGTPAYLSPEQARGAELDGRSDLYSLGILLFEMLTGELPFAGASTPLDLMERRSTGEIRDLKTIRPDVPAPLAAVVRKLLQRDPALRFQNAREVVAALDRRPPRWGLPSHRLAAALGLSVLAIVLTAGRSMFWPEPPSGPALAPPVETPLTAASPAALRAYSQGREHLLRHNETAAISALAQAVTLDPGLTAAWIDLARSRAAAGHRREALDAAQRAVASLGPLGPDSGRVSWIARALEARLRGAPSEARVILADLLARSPHDLEARVDLAEVCGEEGDLSAAVDHLRQVTEADPDHPRAWLLLAKHSIMAGDSRRAIDDYLIQAMVIQNRLQSERGQAEVHNALGVAYNDLGELDHAVESYKNAAEIRRRIGDSRGLAATLRNLASIDAVRGEAARAEERLAEALEILEQLDDSAGMAELSNDLGLLAEESAQYEKAMEHYRRGLQLRRRLGQALPVAESLNNVGYVCYLLGRFDDATVYWQQALGSYRDGGDRSGVAVALQGIGLLQTVQGDWDAAVKSLQESLVASRELGLDEPTAAALLHLGRVELIQGRLRSALASFAEAQSLLREIGDVRGQTEVALAEAEAWLQVGDSDAFGQRLQEAERLLAGADNPEQRADLLRLRGAWHLERGETALARQALRQAVSQAEASQGLVALLQARIAAARLEGKRGLEELRALQAQVETLGHRGLQLQVAEALAEAALSQGDLATSEAAARQGLEAARESGTWIGNSRLHLLLAQVLERGGRAGEASGFRQLAIAEMARLRSGLLVPEQRSSGTIAALP